MGPGAVSIPLTKLALIFLPVLLVMVIYARWVHLPSVIPWASVRMALQLLIAGYALGFLFQVENVWLSCGIVFGMICAASVIALRPIAGNRRKYLLQALGSLMLGGIPVLVLVFGFVLDVRPWFLPRYFIPLAGMVFANSMNSLSLCVDRYHAERQAGGTYEAAREAAYRTALLPLLNSFFAVGLVSIPGLMTGQILAGMSPLVAVRYQILVMCMLLAASGFVSAIYLWQEKKRNPAEGE